MPSNDSQIQALIRQFEQLQAPSSVSPEDEELDRRYFAVTGELRSSDLPKVAIESVLKLTRPQEDRLMEHIERLVRVTADDLGRDEVLQADSFSGIGSEGVPRSLLKDSTEERSHFAKRRYYDLSYHLKCDWREHVLGGIFTEYNFVVPMARRQIQQQISRARNYYFATDPWFSATPQGRSDDELAKEADRFLKYRSRKGGVKGVLGDGIHQSFVQGEAVMKTAFIDLSDFYETMARVAVTPQGQYIMAADGDFIFEHDKWEPLPAVDDISGEPLFDAATGAPVLSDQEVLARDGVTPKPAQLIFADRIITRALTRQRGAEVALVNFLDFICPLQAESVEEAEFCAHLYEQPALTLAQQILLRNPNPEQRSRVIEALRELAGASSQAKTGAMANRPELGEGRRMNQAETQGEPRVKLAEVYLRFDVRGDGHTPSIMVLYNTETQRPLYYDYVANITPDGRRPFHVLRASRAPGRWYGIGQMELLEGVQNMMDMFACRMAKATGDQGTFKMFNPHLTLEGQADPNLRYNDGRVYTPINKQVRIEDVFQSLVIQEPRIQEIQGLMEFLQQHALNLSGVGNVNDAQAAGLDSTSLATGIRNIDRTGQELFGPYLYSLEDGLTSTMIAWAALELFHLDEKEAYEYLEGETRMIGYLTSDKVRNLEMDIRLELTRYRNEQQDIQMAQAGELIEKYYALPMLIQQRTAGFYRQQLKLREIQNADELIDPIDPLISGMGMQGAPGTAVSQPIQPPTAVNPVTPVGPDMPGQAPPNL